MRGSSSPRRRSRGSPRRRRRSELAPGDHQARHLREELRPARGQQVHVPRARACQQDAGAPGDRGDLRCARRRRAHGLGEAQAEAPRALERNPPPLEEGGRDPPSGRHHRAVRRAEHRIMAIKKYKPTSPGRRFATYLKHEAVTKSEPEKALTEGLTKSGGRNTNGRVTARHRGGGAKRRYRKIDFKRRKDGIPAKVAAIEYDPNRSAHIALLHYADGEKRYILAPGRLKVGDTVSSGPNADISPGCCLPLANIPTGTILHCVELTPGRGGQMGRSAGTSIQLVAKEGKYATIGVLGNAEHELVELGKAGRSRHRGKRPQTRGVAMNPVDHPHGGGEAHHTPGGHPTTPWGVPTLGYRTRKKRKASDRYIVRGRRRGKKGRR